MSNVIFVESQRNRVPTTTRKRKGNFCLRITSITDLRLLLISMLAMSCRCRASFSRLQHRRIAAFVGTNAVRITKTENSSSSASLLSSYARIMPVDEFYEEHAKKNEARRPSLPRAPPRARRMPPTLESDYESSSISAEFPDIDITAALEIAEYDYDPNEENGQSYGFFDEPVEFDQDDSTRATTTRDVDMDMTMPESSAWDEPDDEYDSSSEDSIPIEDMYMNNMQQEDVPNPHNYWDDNDDSAPPTMIAPSATKQEADVPPPPQTPAPPKVEPIRATIRKTEAMPPRAMFAFQPPPPQDDREDIYIKASSGDAITSHVEMLTTQLNKLEQDIYAQNNNREFNIKSTKQVSTVLFGQPGQSTNKETLEAMGGAGNVMADLILQYRALSRKIARLSKKETNKANGTLVRNVSDDSAIRSKKKTSSQSSSTAVVNHDGVVEGDPLLLVDASAYIFRAYYSMPPLHRADGMPVGAVLGFCNMLNRLVLSRMLQGECPRLVLVFDAKGKTFRHDLYDEYKANRPGVPMDLLPQFDLIREAAEAYGIQQIEAPNYEADDVIATLATMALKEGVDTNILSGDKDLMQLITPQDEYPSIQMVDPMTMTRVSHDVVVSKWGVTPNQLGDVLALAGDSADNIPGVPGIGPKIAATLIGEYGTLDELLDNVENVKQKGRRQKLMDNVENARLSRQLVELERELPLNNMTFPENVTSAAELRMAPLDSDRLLAFYQDMGLKDMKRRVEARLSSNQKKAVRKKYNGKRRQKAEIPTPEDYKDVPF